MTRRNLQTERILVTGGAGFIGTTVVRSLMRAGYEVVVLDNLQTGSRSVLEGSGIELVEGDILDTDAVGTAMTGVTHVIHLAAQTGVPGSLQDPKGDCRTNVMGTLNLLEAVRSEGVRRFIFASSNAVLGRQGPPATEQKAPLPLSPYGASKLAGEAYCMAYHGSFGLETVALRFSNVYGPFAAHKTSVIPTYIKALVTGNGLIVHGDGGQTRDFIFVDDLAEAILCALHSSCAGEVFQIGSGVATSIRELVDALREVADTDVSVQYTSARTGDIRESRADITKARDLLGWEPRTTLREGLRETLYWFESNHKVRDS